MTPVEMFLWGVGGSIAVELIELQIHYNKERPFPEKYRKIGFWIIRILIAIMAGGLSLAYNVDTPILAINIGAATPLILQALGKSAPAN